jgi:smad nuclear-interacting protein 1
VDKSKPNFAPSGLLAAATNTVKAVDGTSTVLKYNEPPEARKPILGWRLYVFKGSEQVGRSLTFLRQYSVRIFIYSLCARIAAYSPSKRVSYRTG